MSVDIIADSTFHPSLALTRKDLGSHPQAVIVGESRYPFDCLWQTQVDPVSSVIEMGVTQLALAPKSPIREVEELNQIANSLLSSWDENEVCRTPGQLVESRFRPPLLKLPSIEFFETYAIEHQETLSVVHTEVYNPEALQQQGIDSHTTPSETLEMNQKLYREEVLVTVYPDIALAELFVLSRPFVGYDDVTEETPANQADMEFICFGLTSRLYEKWLSGVLDLKKEYFPGIEHVISLQRDIIPEESAPSALTAKSIDKNKYILPDGQLMTGRKAQLLHALPSDPRSALTLEEICTRVFGEVNPLNLSNTHTIIKQLRSSLGPRVDVNCILEPVEGKRGIRGRYFFGEKPRHPANNRLHPIQLFLDNPNIPAEELLKTFGKTHDGNRDLTWIQAAKTLSPTVSAVLNNVRRNKMATAAEKDLAESIDRFVRENELKGPGAVVGFVYKKLETLRRSPKPSTTLRHSHR